MESNSIKHLKYSYCMFDSTFTGAKIDSNNVRLILTCSIVDVQ